MVSDRISCQILHLLQGWIDAGEALPAVPERLAAAQRGLEQRRRPDSLLVRFPEVLAPICLQPLDSRLPALAPFHHALHGFQGMDIVAVHIAIGDAHRLADASPQRHLHLRHPPRHRQARSGHEREAHLARRVVHLFRPLPIPGEVLIVEIRNRPAAGAENLDRTVEKLVTRIQCLTLLIARIVALLADVNYAVHGQLSSAQRERLRNAGTELHARMPFGALHTQVAFAALFDVQRHHVQRCVVIDIAKTVAIQDAFKDMLCVQVCAINIGQHRDPRPWLCGCVLLHIRFSDLEEKPARKLKDSHRTGRSNIAERRRRPVSVWSAPVDVVQRIVGIQTEQERQPLVQAERLG